MRQRDLRRIGILLIVMAFICMGGGLIVSYIESGKTFTAPSFILGQGDGTGISISTVDNEGADGLSNSADSNGDKKDDKSDKNDKDSKNDKDTPKNDKPEVKDENTGSNSGDNKTPNTGDSGNTSDGNTGSTPATSDDTPSQTTPTTPDTPNTPAPQPAPTIDEVNAALRTQLQNTYGIAIKYGSETSGYNVGGLSTVPISDPNVVNKALNEMASTIALYPSGMWTEMKNSGFPLSIYLITKYSAANVTGVTETYSNKVIISIATNFSFGETFNHEVFHYFENYITYFKGATFGSWSGLNPTNFTYGSVDSSLSYSRTFSADAYFVNDYAQTLEGEDRASTFEYMMFANKASCLNNGKPVWKKAKYMAEQLDYYFNSVSPNVTEYWERHL